MPGLSVDPKSTAVLAMDIQKGIAANNAMAVERGIVEHARSVLEAARRAGIPVIHVVIQFRAGYPEVSSRNRMFSGLRQSGRFLIGNDESGVHEALGPLPSDIVISRPRVNAFHGSDLETVLRAKGVDTLVLMGISTNWVVEATARHATDLDYRVVVLEDCCAAASVQDHSYSIENVLKRIGEVATSKDFVDSLR